MIEDQSCDASEPFALRVIGDDMAPEFCDGNIIVVDPGGLIKDGCYVVVRIGEEVLLRQLRQNGQLNRLCALKDGKSEIDLHNFADIIGVVSQRASRRRRDAKRYDL